MKMKADEGMAQKHFSKVGGGGLTISASDTHYFYILVLFVSFF